MQELNCISDNLCTSSGVLVHTLYTQIVNVKLDHSHYAVVCGGRKAD